MRVPLVVFMVCATVTSVTSVDVWFARTIFFAHAEWIGGHSWVANELIHTGGRWFVRACVALALAAWIASFFDRRLLRSRRASLYFTVAVILSVGIVGLLKVITNVDCPWDLHEFGGAYPFVHLFADRPDSLRRAACFPAAHASAGYALMALYFVGRERGVRARRAGLCIGVAFGLVFGLAQQSRGAHFISHDIWSAFITWLVAASLYVFAFHARLWPRGSQRNNQQL